MGSGASLLPANKVNPDIEEGGGTGGVGHVRVPEVGLHEVGEREVGVVGADDVHLFTSGYTKDIVLDKGIEEKDFDFIAKPLSLNALFQKVREVLDR